jgi:hypothetical protein
MERWMMAARSDRDWALVDGAIDGSRGAVASTLDPGGALINSTICVGLGQMASVLGSCV